MQELAAKYDFLDINILEAGRDQSLYEAQFLEILDSGCDIFTCSANYSMADLVGRYADDYPQTTFWFTDLSTSFKFPGTSGNCAGMLFKQNEVMYMAGVLNAALSETGRLGFVGGMESTVICDFGAGYIDGATYVNPNAKIIFSFVGNFDDSAKGKELALIQYNMGADIVHAVAGTAGLGVYEAGAQVNRWTMGVDYDVREKFLSEGNGVIADKILTSSMKMWGNAVSLFIEKYINDRDSIQWGVVEQWGLKEGGVGLCKNDYYYQVVPKDIQDRVAEIEAKIIAGEINPKSAMGMSTAEWAAYKATVAIN
jgi:basic membrane protein A